MKHFIIFPFFVVSTFGDIHESKDHSNITCINSKVVIEERPNITSFTITTDSGEKLLDFNNEVTSYPDFRKFLGELNGLLFPEVGYLLPETSIDFYIINNQTETGNEVRIVNRLGNTSFKKVLPIKPGVASSATRCAHIYGFDLIVDPAFDITMPDGYNVTALIWCSFFGLKDLARSLVERGADVNQIGDRGVTPLAAAIIAGHSEIVQFLLQKGASLSLEMGPFGTGALLLAAYTGRWNTARILIEHGANVNQVRSKDQITPLHAAAEVGRCNLVGLLINNGANVSAMTTDGRTPLHMASYTLKLDCVRRLLKAGANINAKDKNGDTLLILALEHGHNESDALKLVQHLLGQHNPDVNIRNNKGETALAVATKKGFTRVAELLKLRTTA